MCNIISGSEYSGKWKLSQSCCGCTLRTGTLMIGWFELITAIIWIVSIVTGRYHRIDYVGIGSVIVTLVAAICILIGVYKQYVTLVWAAVYLQLILVIWCLVVAIIFFVNLIVFPGVIGLLQMLLCLYFFLVIRSYAFEAESGVPTISPA